MSPERTRSERESKRPEGRSASTRTRKAAARPPQRWRGGSVVERSAGRGQGYVVRSKICPNLMHLPPRATVRWPLSRSAHRLPPLIRIMRGLAPHVSTHTHRAGQSRSLCPFRVRCRPRRVPRSLAVLGGPAALALPRMPSPHTARAHSMRR